MWDNCQPVLDDFETPRGYEILGWEVDGIGEIAVETSDFEMTATPVARGMDVEFRFGSVFLESRSVAYRPVGSASLRLVRTSGLRAAPVPGSGAKGRVLRRKGPGPGPGGLPSFHWNSADDMIHLELCGILYVAKGGVWGWNLEDAGI